MSTERAGAVRRFWHGVQRGRRAFRRWRRGRPFWAGVFLLIGGVQLFLSTQLDLGNLEVSFGPQGFLAVLLPAVLILCGLLIWIMPQHRWFYSVIGTLTAIYSLLGLNLGGWFLGMLFGVIGGGLGMAWTPITPKQPATPTAELPTPDATEPEAAAEPEEPAEPGLLESLTGPEEPPEQQPDERPTERLTGPLVDEPPGTDQTAPVQAPRQPPRTYLIAALPFLLTAALAAPPPAAQICLPLLCPDPPTESPTPSPSEEPEPDPTGEPSPEPDPTPTPAPDPTDPGEQEPADPSPSASPSPSLSPTPIPTLPPPGLRVAAQPALMTADRLIQENFRFEGITQLETADGPIRVLKFTFSRATATNFSLTTTGEGQPARVTADPLILAGDVTFYTDRFVGKLGGAVPLELTPDSPATALLRLLELVPIPVPRIAFTDVNLNLVFTEGAELTAAGFLLSLP